MHQKIVHIKNFYLSLANTKCGMPIRVCLSVGRFFLLVKCVGAFVISTDMGRGKRCALCNICTHSLMLVTSRFYVSSFICPSHSLSPYFIFIKVFESFFVSYTPASTTIILSLWQSQCVWFIVSSFMLFASYFTIINV